MLQPFRELFRGGELGYGEWHSQRELGQNAVTRKGPAPVEAYERHLRGEVGLGVVPVKQDGTCWFGAIDIDIDNIDHVALLLKVRLLEIPLNVCRSKSGGAHLYLFLQESQPANKVIEFLKQWAKALGYTKSEIFPKQTKISNENVGNWINLPYFGGDRTTRYAVNETGALKLAEFLQTVVYFDQRPPSSKQPSSNFVPDGPPCLKILTSNPLREGTRNSILFNMGVYFRKSARDAWQDELKRFNDHYVDPPLDQRELTSILRSLDKSRYQYTCNQSPLVDCCAKDLCQRQKYGVGNKSWDEDGVFTDFEPKNLRKILTDPPHYILGINDQDLKLSFEELTNFGRLRMRCISDLNIVIHPLKQRQWEQHLQLLLTQRTEIAAPSDASQVGLVLDKLFEFLETRANAVSNEDILRGVPIQVNEEVLFRAADLQKFLLLHRITISVDRLFAMLQTDGCRIKKFKVLGKFIEAWAYPTRAINEQQGEFTVPKFIVDEEL